MEAIQRSLSLGKKAIVWPLFDATLLGLVSVINAESTLLKQGVWTQKQGAISGVSCNSLK